MRRGSVLLGKKICRFPYVDDIVYVDITKYSGIGAGILLNGGIFNGKNGVAGELEILLLTPITLITNTGSRRAVSKRLPALRLFTGSVSI